MIMEASDCYEGQNSMPQNNVFSSYLCNILLVELPPKLLSYLENLKRKKTNKRLSLTFIQHLTFNR